MKLSIMNQDTLEASGKKKKSVKKLYKTISSALDVFVWIWISIILLNSIIIKSFIFSSEKSKYSFSEIILCAIAILGIFLAGFYFRIVSDRFKIKRLFENFRINQNNSD